MKLTLHIWRQDGLDDPGRFETYEMDDVRPDMSFLEMLDQLNEQLVMNDTDPVAFEYDCREGICGTCCLVINGTPHGPRRATTTCQTYMRHFREGAEIYIEPFRFCAI